MWRVLRGFMLVCIPEISPYLVRVDHSFKAVIYSVCDVSLGFGVDVHK